MCARVRARARVHARARARARARAGAGAGAAAAAGVCVCVCVFLCVSLCFSAFYEDPILSPNPNPRNPYHPGRNYYKIIPWNILMFNNLCSYNKKEVHQSIFFVLLPPLVCPCSQENNRRNLLCNKFIVSSHFFCEVSFCNHILASA